MLRIAIAKGRLMDSLINYLDVIEYTTLSETLKNRERQLLLSVDNIECILVKGSDVPIYVEQGIADIGIVGSDILDERHYNVNNLLNMPLEHVILRLQRNLKRPIIVKSQRVMFILLKHILNQKVLMSN